MTNTKLKMVVLVMGLGLIACSGEPTVQDEPGEEVVPVQDAGVGNFHIPPKVKQDAGIVGEVVQDDGVTARDRRMQLAVDAWVGSNPVLADSCLDEAPIDSVRTLIGGGVFDCWDRAPCTGGLGNPLEYCEATEPVVMIRGTQLRWWGFAGSLPDVQVPPNACVRIMAGGFCMLATSFGTTGIKYAYAPSEAAGKEGWVEVDVSINPLSCDLSCDSLGTHMERLP